MGNLSLESKTSDYTADATNSGKLFQRTDAGSPTGKIVVQYDNA